MNPTVVFVLACVGTAWSIPVAPGGAAVVAAVPAAVAVAPVAAAVAPAAVVGGLHVGLPVAIGGPWHNGPLVNTVAAWNSGRLSAANTAGIRNAAHWANVNAASWNDANALARQISQQSQANRNAALQAARDQANAINQLAALSQGQRVNHGSNTAQSSSNQAALRQNQANQAIAAQLNAINGGGARDAGINQANLIAQVAAINANFARANSIRWSTGWGAPVAAVVAPVVHRAAAIVAAVPVAAATAAAAKAVIG